MPIFGHIVIRDIEDLRMNTSHLRTNIPLLFLKSAQRVSVSIHLNGSSLTLKGQVRSESSGFKLMKFVPS